MILAATLLSIMIHKSVKAQGDFLSQSHFYLDLVSYIHCHSDYSVTLMSQMINLLCLIPSKWHGLGLFYQHFQLLQHQISGYAWRYLVISPFFLNDITTTSLSADEASYTPFCRSHQCLFGIQTKSRLLLLTTSCYQVYLRHEVHSLL